jgi:hypothetical protein
MDYTTSDPDVIAQAVATELGRPVDYRPVATDGLPAPPASSPNCCEGGRRRLALQPALGVDAGHPRGPVVTVLQTAIGGVVGEPSRATAQVRRAGRAVQILRP